MLYNSFVKVSKLFFQASVEDPTFTGKAVVALGSGKFLWVFVCLFVFNYNI